MSNGQFRLQAEVQQGIIQLLLRAALFQRAPGTTCAVVTASPSQWLSTGQDATVKILDVSEQFGGGLWQTEADLMDRLWQKLQSAGWATQQIAHEYRLPGDRGGVLDAVIVAKDGGSADREPLAAIEVHRSLQPKYLRNHADELAIKAHRLGVSCAFLFDGRVFIPIDQQGAPGPAQTTFPSPAQLGGEQYNTQPTEKDSGTVLNCPSAETLAAALAQITPATVVIDHTLPWGDSRSATAEAFRKVLAEPFVQSLDLIGALLSLVALQPSTKRMVALVPRAITCGSSTGALRSRLGSRLALAACIELPTSVFQPAVSVLTTILAMGDYPITSGRGTLFMALPHRGDLMLPQRERWLSDLELGLAGRDIKQGFRVEIRADDVWLSSAHHPACRDAEQRLKKVAATIPLGEAFDIFIGVPHCRDADESDQGIPVVRGRDLVHGTFSREDLACTRADQALPDRATVRESDILLARIGSPGRCRLISAELAGCIAADSVIVLRPKGDRVDPAATVEFLNSTVGQMLLASRAQGTIAPSVTPTSLKAIPIPILPASVAKDLRELQQVEHELRSRADKIESVRLGLFDADSGEDLSSRLCHSRQMARSIVSSMQQAETVEFQIRNFYPYPISYSYRTLASLTLVQDLYKEQLRVAENILAFLGSLTLAVVLPEDRKKTKINLVETWQGGISPGHWRQICQEGAKVLKDYDDHPLARALAGLWIAKKQTPFSKRIEELIVAKNNYKHDRGPKIEEDFATEAKRVGQLLTETMTDLAFMIDYPIRLVRDVDVIRGTRRVMLNTLRYVGDHPGMPQERVEYAEPLTKNDLYIEVAGRWTALYPFITVQACPTCKVRETYTVDHWRGPGVDARLKSFERGHTEESSEVAAGMAAW